MEKFCKRRAAIAALVFSALGSAELVGASNSLPQVSEQISFVRQFTDENSEAMLKSDSLKEVVPQKSDDEIAWKKTWNNSATFCENFGDIWA